MERLLLRPAEAAEALGLGRSKVYELLSSGLLPAVRIGHALRVPAGALRDWVARQTAEEEMGTRRETKP
jgi:excisionase family DNA binding protein